MIWSLVNSVFSSRNSKSDLDNFFLVETQPMIFVLLLVKTIRTDTHRSMDIRENDAGSSDGGDEDEKEIN